MARKGLVAVVLAAGLMALGCGGSGSIVDLTPSPAMVATATGTVSPVDVDGLAAGFGEKLASALELGNAYQMVASVGYGMQDITLGPITVDETIIGLGFTYYLDAVENDDNPIGVQEFLQQVNEVGVDVTMLDLADTTRIAIDGDYGFMDQKLIAIAGVSFGGDVFGFTAGAGYKIQEELGVQLTINIDTDDSGAVDVKTTDIGIGAEYVMDVADHTLDLQLGIDLISMDSVGDPSGTGIAIGATYYVLQELGVSVNFMTLGGDFDSSSFGIGATYYYGALGIGLNYESGDIAGVIDTSTIGFDVEYRF